MTDSNTNELTRRFKEFTGRILRRKTREVVRLEGRLFKRRIHDPLARIEREDFMTPTSLGTTKGLIEIQWAAVRAGSLLHRRYYLVAIRVVGNIETQQLHYELIEYRFAGAGKFKRDPRRRQRRVAISETYDPQALPCLDDIDTGWTGRERRFDRTKTLSSFDDHLHF